MLPKGSIAKIYKYYFTKPQFKDEIIRAFREFFNRPNLFSGGKLELKDEKDEEMFNEWFIFDFRLSNGNTPLEDFYERNPYNFNIIQLQAYKDLQDNHYGLYKTKEVRLGEGLALENLQTGRIYQVREFSATFGLKEGQVISGRVGKVGDHYELVGSNPSFGPVKLDANIEKSFREDKTKLNPKVLRENIFKDNLSEEGGMSFNDYSSPKDAENTMKKVLKKYELDRFVTTETLKEWIYQSFF